MSDAPSPIIFKRSKAKSATRARQAPPENDERSEDASNHVENPPSALASQLKKKIKRSQVRSRLSFGADNEEEGDSEVFQVKKSNLSKKMSLGMHPANLPPTLDQATISAHQGPKYDAAYLQELKASTPTAKPPRSLNVDPYDAEMTMDIGDSSAQTITIQDVDETAATFIPSESSIKVAKEKRERLRAVQNSGDEDFISLSVSRRDDFSQGPHPESRLVREEDELGEGDDEFAEYTSAQERIALGKQSRKLEANQRRTTMKEMIADAGEHDEETDEWEQEQLRRGGHKTPEPSSSKVKKVYKPAPIPPVAPIPTLGPAISKLSERLAQLTTSHARNSATLNSLAQERQEVEKREVEMREMVEKAEEKRAWFSNFKDWTESVAEFLDEKYPMLEKLEDEFLSLVKERFEMIAKRRREDNEDDLAAFIGPLPTPPSEEAEELDELGRVIPVSNPLVERRERRVARTARRQIRSSHRTRPQGEEEGYSTDSSLTSYDSLAYTGALQSLASRAKEVLADVKVAEFKDPGKGRWSTWREKYSDSYVGAWGGLGVVSAWEFWVRLESVGWDCIGDQRNLDNFKWYKGLYEYSRPGEGSIIEERELGPDGDLVASMISTAIIPYVCRVLENGGLDVYSLRDMRRMIDLAEEIEASLDSEGGKFQNVVKSVTSAFEKAVSEMEGSIAKYTASHQRLPGFNPESIPSRRRFLNRCVKLLSNMLLWRKYAKERFGIGGLITRFINNCIVVIAQTGWEVGGEDITLKVVKMMPPELLPPQLSRLS